MAKGGVETKPQPSVEAEKPQEAKAESKEQALSDIGRQRAERAQATISKGVEAVKGSIGKGLSFLKEKGMALLAIDVAAARAGKATGEFIKQDAAKTAEHAKAVGGAIAEGAKAVGGAVKEDWDQTRGDIKAAGKFAADSAKSIGKGALEVGKTAVEVGVIAGAVGVEVGKFAAKKTGEGVEAVSKFAAKKIEQTMDSAQKKYEEISGAISKLEQSARGKINGARDKFNATINAFREDPLKETIVTLFKISKAMAGPAPDMLFGSDAETRLRSSIDQSRVNMLKFFEKHHEQKLEALKAKLEKAQSRIASSSKIIEALSS